MTSNLSTNWSCKIRRPATGTPTGSDFGQKIWPRDEEVSFNQFQKL